MITRFSINGKPATGPEAVAHCSRTSDELLGGLIDLLLAKKIITPNESEELFWWEINVSVE